MSVVPNFCDMVLFICQSKLCLTSCYDLRVTCGSTFDCLHLKSDVSDRKVKLIYYVQGQDQIALSLKAKVHKSFPFIWRDY